jgi:CTP:molybdopterin cytidylyltransferase MocA
MAKFLTSIVLAAGLSRRMGEENKLLLPFGGATILETTLLNIIESQMGETLVVVGHEAEDVVRTLAQNFRFQISNFRLAARQDLLNLNLKVLVNLKPDEHKCTGNLQTSPNVLNAQTSNFKLEKDKLQTHLPPLSINAENQPFLQILMNENYEKGMTTSIQTGVEAANDNSLGHMICLSDMPFITPAEYRFLADAFFSILENDKQAIVQPIFEGNRGNPTIFSSFYKKDILNLTYTEGCKPIVQTNKTHLYLVEMPTKSVLQDIDLREEYLLLGRL